jgi:hypothetical protein
LTIDFALFLSPEGIALAHRQPAGHWAFVGDTALDVPDFKGALDDLRQKGEARGGKDFATVLILPDDQILYTSLTVPPGDDPLRDERIAEGLDGQTPYAVADLVWDLREVDDIRIKLAVVARETLDEARAFASDAGFNGVAFAAAPSLDRFPGVPVFGKTDDGEVLLLPDEGLAFGRDQWQPPAPKAETEPPATKTAPDASDKPEVGTPEPVKNEQTPGAAKDDTATDPVADAKTNTDPVADAKTVLPVGPVTEAPAPDTAKLEAKDTTTKAPVLGTPVQDTPLPNTPLPVISATDDAAAPAENATLADTRDDLPLTSGDDDTPPLTMDDDATRPVMPLPDADDADDGEALPDAAPEPEPKPEPEPEPEPKDADTGSKAPSVTPPLTATKDSGTPPPKPRNATGLTAKRPEPGAAPGLAARASRITPIPPDTPMADTLPDDDATPDDDVPAMPLSFVARHGRGISPQHGNARVISDRREGTAMRAPGDMATGPRVLHPDTTNFQTETGAVTGGGASKTLPPPSLAEQLGRVRDASRSPAKPAVPRSDQIEVPPPLPRPIAATLPQTQNDAVTGGLLGRIGGLIPTRRKDQASTDQIASRDDGVAVDDTDRRLTGGLLARSKNANATAGPSFRTGLILTLILLILLAIIAIWAALFLPNSGIARLFDRQADAVVEIAVAADGTSTLPISVAADNAAALIASISDVQAPATLPDIDADLGTGTAAIEAMPLPSLAETEAMFATHNIWQLPPDAPPPGSIDTVDGIYTAAIDPPISGFDAIALPPAGVSLTESVPRQPTPPPFGTVFAFNDQGLVAPTPEGTLTPAGAFVIAGSPPVAAVPRPRSDTTVAPVIDVEDAILGTFRPAPRPGDLGELRERQVLGGLTVTELATRRPSARAASAQEVASATATASLVPLSDEVDGAIENILAQDEPTVFTGSGLAIAASTMPRTRPATIERIAVATESAPEAVETAAVAAAPSIPSNTSVARAATEDNVLNLRRINLIGVTGTSADRRALVRLPSGRFLRLGIGDRIDGGRVAAIGATTLQYIKNGRNITLDIAG